jgi:deoxyguanosine kinase
LSVGSNVHNGGGLFRLSYLTRTRMLPEKYRYIVVDGPIGAGKTSLALRLATQLGAALLLEKPDENPFLQRFYGDVARYALPTQLFFLFQRINQLRDLAQLDMFESVTVSDFLLDKDPLFARLTLPDAELILYQQIFDSQSFQAPPPDLVIYLQAPVETLISRVKRRGNAYERSISEEYLAKLADSYSRFFYHYDAAPVLIVNSEHLNFVDEQKDFELLLSRIAQMRSPREFFNVGE